MSDFETYVITEVNRYEVIAKNAEQALASYRVWSDNLEPELMGLEFHQVIPQDNFEYLGGSASAEEKSE
jgi:hypothetical protein